MNADELVKEIMQYHPKSIVKVLCGTAILNIESVTIEPDTENVLLEVAL